MSLVMGLLLACDEGAVVNDKKEGGTEDADDTGDPGDDPSAFTGSYAGTIDGHANFDATYESTPYCTGALSASVMTDGSFTAEGDCEIAWGPYMGEVFAASVAGTVDAQGAVTGTASLSYTTEERSWDDATLSGTGDATARTLEATGDSQYYPLGLDPIEAFMRVTLQ